jgi:hypothetical protein
MSMILSGDGTITGLVAGGLPDATVIQSDLASGVGGTGSAFSVYGTSLTTAAQNTFTKIVYDTEDFDTNNNFSSSRFTPTVAGYYNIQAYMYASVTASGGVFASIFKNGSRYCDGTSLPVTNPNDVVVVVSAVVYCNGSTDYIEIYGYQGYAASAGLGSNNYLRKFCGNLVRGA